MDTEVQAAVFDRDGRQCVAPWLGATDRCATLNGQMPRAGVRDDHEIDHVRYPAGMAPRGMSHGGYGKRPSDDGLHLVTLCYHHHQAGWATRNRYVLRVYLLWQALRQHVLTGTKGTGPEWWDHALDLAEQRP